MGVSKTLLLTIIRPLLPRLKKWLGDKELEEGEISKNVLLSVDKKTDEIRIDIITLKLDTTKKPPVAFINRVLQKITQDEII